MFPPSATEAGGAFWAMIVLFAAKASVTFPAAGVPVTLITVSVVATLRSRVTRNWSVPTERDCAGRTVKRSVLRGKAKR